MRPCHTIVLGLAVVLAAGLLSGCAKKRTVRAAGVQTAARQGYLDGLVELDDGNYLEAARQFHAVAASPRYFRYTALAALRAADALFYQESYAQALEAYMGFIKRYAGNPNVPYAEFRVVQCHFERLPGDWFILPPAFERDLATTRAAYDAARRFLTMHPRHRFSVQARRIRDFAAERLYANHIYVANFYQRRDKPAAVAQRLEWAMAEFPDAAATEENLLRLAKAYAELKDTKGTLGALRRYLDKHPDGTRHDEVSTWLAELEAVDTPPEAPPEAPDEL